MGPVVTELSQSVASGGYPRRVGLEAAQSVHFGAGVTAGGPAIRLLSCARWDHLSGGEASEIFFFMFSFLPC